MSPSSSEQNVKALSPRQERKLVDFLDERFLDITRNFKKRSETTTLLPTLSSYLKATHELLSLILQIPPIDPSTSLRTTFLLRLTNEILSSIPGYLPDPDTLPEVLDWLDDLDQAWYSVLRSQIWSPTSGATDNTTEAKSTPLNQTERTRLRSLLVGGLATLEEWLAKLVNEEEEESVLERLGLQAGFDGLFMRTLEEMGALGGLVLQ